MARRAPFLLTSLRLATKQPTTAEPAEMAGLLAGWLRLWTAAILRDAARRPRLADPTDHDAAHADGLYLIPDQAPPTLAESWSERARQAGAELLPAGPGDPAELERDTDLAALGLGVLLLDTLTEAMDHMPTLDEEAFWAQVQTAATSEDAPRQEALRAAADLLRQAREALYPSQLTLLELTLLADLPPADWRPGPLPANLLLSGSLLERWATDRPEQFALVHQELVQQRLEIVAGPWDDRDDLLAPLVLQEENLRRGLASYRRHLGHDPFVYGQVAAGLGPQTPQQLLAEEVRHALLTPLGPGGLPPFRGAVLEWPARDGQSITAHVRPWHGRELPTALFNLPCQLHETIMQDFAAVHGLVGPMSPGPTGPTWHRLWLRLHEWAPVFGHHHTLRHWFSEAYASERPTRLRCDDFTVDGLVRRAEGKLPEVLRDLPALHAAEAERQAGRNLAALLAWLGPAPPDSDDLGTAATALAQRMVAKAEPEAVGYMVLNPCGMPRTVTAKLPGATTPMPRPARASKVDAGAVEVVVDLPPFGYAWLPRAIAPGTRILMPQGELAHSQCVQNDLIEAWVDAATGGLRDLRQPGARAGRLGQQLVYQPGSRMVARSVRIASTGPIRGEIVCEGDLLDAEGQVRAQFRQTFTVCWGQPYLHLCIELEPRRLPSGYAWQDYFGCRWAWSDPTALLARPTGWLLEASGAARIESPLGLELHSSAGRTGLLTRGLAYHQRVGERMLDVILIAPGETRRTFDLTVALEPDDLVMAAADVLAPAPVVEVAAGPPRSGPTGWLFDLEAVNVWLMDVTQPSGSEVEPGSLDLHLAEVRGAAVQTRLRCCRSVATATVVNELGTTQQTLPVSSTEVELNLAAWERLRVRLTFGGNAPLPSLPAT